MLALPRYKAHNHRAFVLRVDEETGKLEVVKLYTSIYAGRVVNRPGAELQNEGAMIMGLGTALFEEIAFADGQVMNANLSDYNIPAAEDLPDLTYDLVEREGAEIHGLGETALPPVPAAIGNALHSLGIHITELPMSAERVLHAIDRRNAAQSLIPETSTDEELAAQSKQVEKGSD